MLNIAPVLIVNKPRGWTSRETVDYIKRKTGARKAGHAGTLDPLATGILIILIGAATKRQNEFMKLPKEYEVTIVFGEERDTYDSGGKITKKAKPSAIKSLTEDDLRQALTKFKGKIQQRVPPYSAVKVGGKRLYKLAREGKLDQIEIPTREVTIYSIEVLDFTPLNGSNLPTARLKIVCSSGTYIRSIAHDLGKALGVYGYVKELLRSRIGPYGIEEAIPLETKSGVAKRKPARLRA